MTSCGSKCRSVYIALNQGAQSESVFVRGDKGCGGLIYILILRTSCASSADGNLALVMLCSVERRLREALSKFTMDHLF